ncbi:MAG: hypothetical protein JEZ11_13400 [Desulfobacterales bacterium]|nr:hypothetical protein [Desulfobacterales bacterium]
MDTLLDTLWLHILTGMEFIAGTMDTLLAPLHVLGPAGVILILVVATVCLTKFLNRVYCPKRYGELEEEYHHWLNLRQEAMACEDREKGKAMAKNIDQAKLNKAYYDYFFEGFLKNILTTILPVLLVSAYINHGYTPATLMSRFGQPHIFKFANFNGEPLVIGAFFWFVIALLMVYPGWMMLAAVFRRHFKRPKKQSTDL